MKLNSLESKTGQTIIYRCWLPATPPKAVIQIAHGMAEHGARYQWLAEQFNAAGYAVYLNDHRGHGETAKANKATYGDYGQGGWMAAVDDLHAMNQMIRQEHPTIPLILLGHSMGSHLTQTYLIKHSETVDATIISGTTGKTKPLIYVGSTIAKLLRLFKGAQHKSPLMEKTSYDEFNKPFNKGGKARTRFDWLSRDTAQVDKYVADPWCGFACTNQYWIDLFSGVLFNENNANLTGINKSLPVYLLTGSEDTSNNAEKGVRALEKRYKASGISNVTVKIYPEGRHEMFNEINREEVAADTIAWVESQL